METKQTITINITKGEHNFTFTMPVGTSWGNAVDAAWTLLDHVGTLARQSITDSKPVLAESTEPVIEPTLVEGN